MTGTSALIAGHGADVWGRVTAVASKLTVNVSQAWQKSILADGEGELRDTLQLADIHKLIGIQRHLREKIRASPKQ